MTNARPHEVRTGVDGLTGRPKPIGAGCRSAFLNAEQAYVGALLWLDAPRAAVASGFVEGDDLSSPLLRLVHRLAEQLAEAGIAPEPMAVLSTADAEDHVRGETATRELMLALADLYDHRATLPASVRFYAGHVLRLAEIRRTAEMGARLAQAAERVDGDLDDLADLARDEQAAVDAIRARRAALEAVTG